MMFCILLCLSLIMFISNALFVQDTEQILGFIGSFIVGVSSLAIWTDYKLEKRNVHKPISLSDSEALIHVERSLKENNVTFTRYARYGMLLLPSDENCTGVCRFFTRIELFKVEGKGSIELIHKGENKTLIVIRLDKDCDISFRQKIMSAIDSTKIDFTV